MLILLLVHLAAALAATVVALLVLQGPLRTFLASRLPAARWIPELGASSSGLWPSWV